MKVLVVLVLLVVHCACGKKTAIRKVPAVAVQIDVNHHMQTKPYANADPHMQIFSNYPCMQNRDQQGSPHANICSIWGSGDPNLHMHATTICIPFLQVTGLSPFGDSPFAYSRCLHMVIKIDTYLDHLTFDQALGLCTWDQIVVVQTDQSNKCQHLTQVQITLTATRD